MITNDDEYNDDVNMTSSPQNESKWVEVSCEWGASFFSE